MALMNSYLAPTEDTPASITSTVKLLDDNRHSIHRWFWKGLFAFNLIIGSLVFWLSIVPRLI